VRADVAGAIESGTRDRSGADSADPDEIRTGGNRRPRLVAGSHFEDRESRGRRDGLLWPQARVRRRVVLKPGG